MFMGIIKAIPQMSPSMRREWIEMSETTDLTCAKIRLPPCGGSGLKYNSHCVLFWNADVSLHAEGVD